MALPDRGQVPRHPQRRCSTSSRCMLGGRVAEELVFDDPTTGASNDIEKATDDRPRDGHAVRHERAPRARCASARRRARCSSAATSATRATTPRRSPPSDRRRRCARFIDAAHHEALRDPRRQPRRARHARRGAAREGDARQGRRGAHLRAAAPATGASGLDRFVASHAERARPGAVAQGARRARAPTAHRPAERLSRLAHGPRRPRHRGLRRRHRRRRRLRARDHDPARDSSIDPVHVPETVVTAPFDHARAEATSASC